MDQPAPLPPNSAELAVVERFAALIDGLCAALMAAAMPERERRTWFSLVYGALFARPSRQLMNLVCAELRGISDRFRALAAEYAAGLTLLPSPGSHDADRDAPMRGDAGADAPPPCRPVTAAPRAARSISAPLSEPGSSASASAEPNPASQSGACAAMRRVGPMQTRRSVTTANLFAAPASWPQEVVWATERIGILSGGAFGSVNFACRIRFDSLMNLAGALDGARSRRRDAHPIGRVTCAAIARGATV